MGTLVSKGGADRDLPLGHYTLRAPIDGTVLTREVHAGQSVEDTATAFLVADLRYLWVELRIPERHLTLVQRGDAVTIHPMGQQESQQQATVAYVGDLIDPATGTGTVRVDIDNSARILRPGQTVVATVVPQRGERQTLTIADAAVTSIDGVPTVFVESSDGLVRPQAVVLGAKVRDRREVLSGLTAGDRVVTSGVFAIKSELYR
jgi:cobalt-zinc-cadmium efflux system membrane fusion protein